MILIEFVLAIWNAKIHDIYLRLKISTSSKQNTYIFIPHHNQNAHMHKQNALADLTYKIWH